MRNSGIPFPIQKINDKLYQVVAEYPTERVSEVTPIKEWLNCDVTFRTKNATYIFCRTIEEAEIVEDPPQ